jgi:hypothetical protein
VVVLAGETETEVPETDPTPGLTDTEVAPETLQDRIEAWPCWIDGGLAVKDWIVGAGAAVTATDSEDVALPDEFVAVRV